MTTWGAQIEAGSLGYPEKGKRPAYLSDTDKVRWYREYNTSGYVTNVAGLFFGKQKHGSSDYMIAFQLPADHYAYRAIEAGFTPWGGGPNAPDDWDGGNVLSYSGVIITSRMTSLRWTHNQTVPVYQHRDIIGYRKRTVPQTDETYETAVRLLNALTDRIGQARLIALPDTIGVLTQIDNVTSGMSVFPPAPLVSRDDVIHECIAKLETVPGTFTSQGLLRGMLPPDPIAALAKEYEAQRKYGESSTAEDVIRWMKEREN